MPVLRVTRWEAAAALAGAALLAALAGGCDGEEDRPPPSPSGGTSNGPGAGGSGGAGGAGGEGGQGGAGGEAGPGLCGDDVRGAGEDCDGADLAGQSCASLGFEAGTLGCTTVCTLDVSACSSAEQCQDTLDNDADGAADCDDADCAAACADACATPAALADPGAAAGDTAGHAALAEPLGCLDPTTAGPSVAYVFTAGADGLLDVELTSASLMDLALAVRTTCGSAATELSCANAVVAPGTPELITMPVTQGQTVYLLVGGEEPGEFTITADVRSPACGDGDLDSGEACDDGNQAAGDGCSAQCALEPSEAEPNDTPAAANPLVQPFFGAVSPLSDEDWIALSIPSGPTSLRVETMEVNAGACTSNQMDPAVDVLDATGSVVLASDDDGGPGYCARATAPALAAGDYLIRVRRAGLGPFPYRLDVTLISDVCGDGNVTPGEQCDDGNTAAGDGCSAACQIELDEVEPNNTAAQANTFAAPSPFLGAITPAGDEDVVAVMVPGPSSTLQAAVGDGGTGACAAYQLDSFVEILGPDGATVLVSDDDTGLGYCSVAQQGGLAAGTYFVRVKAPPIQPSATFLYSLAVLVQ